jgi:hypothetical protein
MSDEWRGPIVKFAHAKIKKKNRGNMDRDESDLFRDTCANKGTAIGCGPVEELRNRRCCCRWAVVR